MCEDVNANKSLYGNERETPSIRATTSVTCVAARKPAPRHSRARMSPRRTAPGVSMVPQTRLGDSDAGYRHAGLPRTHSVTKRDGKRAPFPLSHTKFTTFRRFAEAQDTIRIPCDIPAR